MITTGIVREININSNQHIGNKYLVEINLFQIPGDTKKSNYTYLANCCIAGGLYATIDVGDKVYIGFLNDDLSLPIILGHIYQGVKEQPRSFAYLNTLKVSNSATFPSNTTIGNITYKKLEEAVNQVKQLVSNTYYQHNIIATAQTYKFKFSFSNKYKDKYDSSDLSNLIKELSRLYVSEIEKADINSTIFKLLPAILLDDVPGITDAQICLNTTENNLKVRILSTNEGIKYLPIKEINDYVNSL